jgi:hypothetical protein
MWSVPNARYVNACCLSLLSLCVHLSVYLFVCLSVYISIYLQMFVGVFCSDICRSVLFISVCEGGDARFMQIFLRERKRWGVPIPLTFDMHEERGRVGVRNGKEKRDWRQTDRQRQESRRQTGRQVGGDSDQVAHPRRPPRGRALRCVCVQREREREEEGEREREREREGRREGGRVGGSEGRRVGG